MDNDFQLTFLGYGRFLGHQLDLKKVKLDFQGPGTQMGPLVLLGSWRALEVGGFNLHLQNKGSTDRFQVYIYIENMYIFIYIYLHNMYNMYIYIYIYVDVVSYNQKLIFLGAEEAQRVGQRSHEAIS